MNTGIGMGLIAALAVMEVTAGYAQASYDYRLSLAVLTYETSGF
jgi:hypothetical protein